MPATILEKIVATKRDEVAAAKKIAPLEAVRRRAMEAASPRDFYGAVSRRTSPMSWIGEIKQKSPSAGVIRSACEPAALAREYAAAGAAALSVLTDREYFGGNPANVEMAKGVTRLPVLRKDFIVDAYQVYESRAIGADAVLFIASILTPEQIETWSRCANELGMASLIEVHNEAELAGVREMTRSDHRAILGINNRDLHRQVTDLAIAEGLAQMLKPGTPFVAESGIATCEDVARMQSAGATALLIGETFMRAACIRTKAGELLK